MLVNPTLVLLNILDYVVDFMRKPCINLQHFEALLSFDSNPSLSIGYHGLLVPIGFVGFCCGLYGICRMALKGTKIVGLWTQRKGCSRGTGEETVEQRSRRKQDETSLESELVENEKEIEELHDTIVKLDQKLDKERTANRQLEKLLQEQKLATESALTRLSEQISLKLADNNPNIADLSDANRPTNLVERFSVLYDDEWTEAFEAMLQIPGFEDETKTIKTLLKFLMVCYGMCREQSSRQLRSMFSVNENTIPMEQIPTEMKKLVKDTRKKHASLYLPLLYDVAIGNLKESYVELVKEDAVISYIKRCTEVCWLMSVQDPPMALSDDVGKDRKYNRSKFREYTKAGPFIDYLVWPTVLIQDAGDMMAKGIAQCRDKMIENTLNIGTASQVSEKNSDYNGKTIIGQKSNGNKTLKEQEGEAERVGEHGVKMLAMDLVQKHDNTVESSGVTDDTTVNNTFETENIDSEAANQMQGNFIAKNVIPHKRGNDLTVAADESGTQNNQDVEKDMGELEHKIPTQSAVKESVETSGEEEEDQNDFSDIEIKNRRAANETFYKEDSESPTSCKIDMQNKEPSTKSEPLHYVEVHGTAEIPDEVEDDKSLERAVSQKQNENESIDYTEEQENIAGLKINKTSTSIIQATSDEQHDDYKAEIKHLDEVLDKADIP